MLVAECAGAVGSATRRKPVGDAPIGMLLLGKASMRAKLGFGPRSAWSRKKMYES